MRGCVDESGRRKRTGLEAAHWCASLAPVPAWITSLPRLTSRPHETKYLLCFPLARCRASGPFWRGLRVRSLQ